MSAPALTPLEAEAAQAAAAAAAEKFNIEAFTLLGVGLTVTILRTIARVKAVGWRNFQPDDYLAWAAAVSTYEKGLVLAIHLSDKDSSGLLCHRNESRVLCRQRCTRSGQQWHDA